VWFFCDASSKAKLKFLKRKWFVFKDLDSPVHRGDDTTAVPNVKRKLSLPPASSHPKCFRHPLKPPCGPAPGGDPLPLQIVRNLPGGAARRLQFADAGQDALLRQIRFQPGFPLCDLLASGSVPHPAPPRRNSRPKSPAPFHLPLEAPCVGPFGSPHTASGTWRGHFSGTFPCRCSENHDAGASSARGSRPACGAHERRLT